MSGANIADEFTEARRRVAAGGSVAVAVSIRYDPQMLFSLRRDRGIQKADVERAFGGVATYGRREFSRPFDSTEDHWTIQGVAAVDDCAQAKKSAAP